LPNYNAAAGRWPVVAEGGTYPVYWFHMFGKRIAIDLGTANVLVYAPKRGIVINEPCVVAVNTADNRIVAIGEEAREMLFSADARRCDR
jgi:hypothetical protein